MTSEDWKGAYQAFWLTREFGGEPTGAQLIVLALAFVVCVIGPIVLWVFLRRKLSKPKSPFG